MNTLAVVFTEMGKAEIAEIEMPAPQAGEVQIQTDVSFISVGTERWVLKNEFDWQPTPYPCVPGYQRIGKVVQVGPGVNDFRIGDRVAATTGIWPGDVAPAWGSHLRLANSRMEEVFRLPSNIADENASGAVVAQVGWNAASRLRLSEGEWVVVFGDGLVGQCASQSVRARGSKAILVGRNEARLAIASAHSADKVVDSREGRVSEQIREAIGDGDLSGVIDTLQAEEVLHDCIALFGHFRSSPGQIVYAGFTPGKVWADMSVLQRYEVTCHFVSGWNRRRMEETLRQMENGNLSLSPFITHRVNYRQAPDMYDMILQKHSPFLGITLDWKEEQR
ncbi:zinc-binding dehydrogenase [Cohnella nanjingensis]|uniref:Zinc-binding dehydrogenase n=1 Tax=Cohnella nanjingensis TaxID=1387779 RepID=A0A7X0RM62_9BACL|nr:zinc-binding dehydrogenase [Cohnella nanjingensis]MBB6670022.1 zinc-binding dehydrogenase [Cohnella nanjingensis]